jgi:hypothetical protein
MPSVNDIGRAIAQRVTNDIRDNHPEIILAAWNERTIRSVVSSNVAQALHELVWDEPARQAIVASAARQGIIIDELETRDADHTG